MIYLDYAAATPMSKKALDAMMPYFSDNFFNPSAIYLPAKKVRADYEDAKSRIAHCIGAKGTDLIITGSATEANNIAFTIVTKKCLALETEHDSILNVAKNYNHEFIKVKPNGQIDLEDFKSKLNKDVELVSISLVNNEIGTIQPFNEIAEIIKNEKENRFKNGIKTPLYLHSDASQAMNLLDINVARLGVDMITLNSAKIYGPKGVGALFASHDVKLKSYTFGGGQENDIRSGTENITGVIGFAASFEDVKNHVTFNRKRYEKIKEIFLKEIKRHFSEKNVLQFSKQLANFCPLIFPGVDAERIIFKLEENGVYISTGAACAASKGKKSHVLKAIGLTDKEIAGSLRITFGADTTEESAKTAATIIAKVVKEEYDRQK